MDDTETTQTYFRRRFAHPARPILFIAAVLTVVVGYGALSLLGRGQQPSAPAMTGAGPVGGTVRAAPTTYTKLMTRSATVTGTPQIYVTPNQSGWVRQITAGPGQRVGAGSVLAWLQPANESATQSQGAYQSALDNQQMARAALSDARAALDARRADVQSQTGTVTSARSALAAAKNTLTRAQADLTAANQEVKQQTAALQQAQELSRQGAGSQSEVQRAQAAVARATNGQQQAANAVDEAQTGVTSAGGDLADAQQALRRSLAAQSAAVTTVRNAEANLRQQQAAVSRAQAAMGQAKMIQLRSPVNGTVASVLIQPGVLATPSTQVIGIVPMGVSAVEFAVSNAEATKLRAGAQVRITSPALGVLPGQVQGVFPTSNGGEAPNRVIVQVQDPQAKLKPGTHVVVAIPLQNVSAVAIPRSALLLGGTNAAVQVRRDGTVSTRPVTIAGYQGTNAIITEGLSPGEEVVISVEPLRGPLLRPLR